MIRQIKYKSGKTKLAAGIRNLCRILSCECGILVNGTYSLSAMEVAKAIEGCDLYVNQGIRLAAQAIAEINTATGCGTKEAAVMMEYLLAVCEKKDASGENPVYLAKKIKWAADMISEEIISYATPSSYLVEQLQTITKNPETADMVLRGMNEGELVVKESMQADTSLEIIRGLYLIGKLVVGTGATTNQIAILIVNQTLSSFMELYPILEKLGNQGLLILADHIEGEARTLLNSNVKKDRLRVWGVEVHGVGRLKDDIMKDVAILTGTQVFDGQFPCSFKDITLDMLGKAESITITDQYSIISSDFHNPSIQKRIASIKKKMNDLKTNYYDQQKLRERIAGLSGAVPVIYVGGNTVIQCKEEKRRLEYAVAYAQTVQKHGIFKMEYLKNLPVENEVCQILVDGIKKSITNQEVSAWLLAFLIQKVCGLIRMWLTTGAVMVSTGYDREDRELIKSGVDVERLRG